MSLDVSPDPAVPGQDLTVEVDAFTRQTVVASALGDQHVASADHKVQENTYAIVDVFDGPKWLWSQNVDVCQGKYVNNPHLRASDTPLLTVIF